MKGRMLEPHVLVGQYLASPLIDDATAAMLRAEGIQLSQRKIDDVLEAQWIDLVATCREKAISREKAK